ncbi:hypothetical protein CI266_004994 [Salmonella enterica subsp. enterica serovar Kotte]|nr:hypothetical protein [Salmonella enterica subsp. enterica serovar Kotte]
MHSSLIFIAKLYILVSLRSQNPLPPVTDHCIVAPRLQIQAPGLASPVVGITRHSLEVALWLQSSPLNMIYSPFPSAPPRTSPTWPDTAIALLKR